MILWLFGHFGLTVMSIFKDVQGNFVAMLHWIPIFSLLCNHFKKNGY